LHKQISVRYCAQKFDIFQPSLCFLGKQNESSCAVAIPDETGFMKSRGKIQENLQPLITVYPPSPRT